MLLLAALLLRLYAQSVALNGAGGALDVGRLSAMLTRTVWGWGWLLQAAGTAIVLGGFWSARGGGMVGWGIALLGAVALAFSPALSGHAAAAEPATLAVLSDGLHVLGAGGWLGSLLFVVIVGLPAALRLDPQRRGPTVAALINAFSPTALLFAGVVTVTGVFAAWLHLGGFAELWGSGYGRTLLLKVGLLSVVFGTGAYNWRRVRPALGTARAASHLRRSATLELTAGALVLIVTAFLVATPPPDVGGMEADAVARTTSAAVAGEKE